MQLKNIVSFLKKHGRRAGFTMIELLVVIAILGILAATVLAAINPVEQINRARDTREQSDAAQLATGVQRFYTSQQKYPWNVSSATAPGFTATVLVPTAAVTLNSVAANTFNWGLSMEDTGELVKGFVERLTNQQSTGDLLYVWKVVDANGISNPLNICFLPRSFTYKQQAMNDCNAGKNPAGVAGITPCPASPAVIGGANLVCLNGS